MILVSRNIKYMQIFVGVPQEGRQLSHSSNGHGLCPLISKCALTYLWPVCVTWPHLFLTPFITSSMVDRNVVTWVWMKKRQYN